jgi:hypothetical protein
VELWQSSEGDGLKDDGSNAPHLEKKKEKNKMGLRQTYKQ